MYLSLIWEPLPEATRQSIISNSTFIPLIIITILYLLPTPRWRPRSGRATPWPQGGGVGLGHYPAWPQPLAEGGAGILDFFWKFSLTLACLAWQMYTFEIPAGMIQHQIWCKSEYQQIYILHKYIAPYMIPHIWYLLYSLWLGEYSRSVSRIFRHHQGDQKGHECPKTGVL